MIKVIVFDFDDTLVPSEHIKQTGFVDIFSSIPKAAPVVKDYLDKNFGNSRHKTILDILSRLKEKRIINFEVTDDVIGDFVNKFGRLVDYNIAKEREVGGAGEVLKTLSKRFILSLNSNTPKDSLEWIIRKRGWKVFFKGIYGSPPGTKLDNLKDVIKQFKVVPSEVVVVGDGESDMQSARAVGALFVGVSGEYSWWLQERKDFVVANNLKEILKLVLLS